MTTSTLPQPVKELRSVGPAIPRRLIHVYCAPEGASGELPLMYRAAVTGARLLNPDFEHTLFDQQKMDRFVAREFPEYQTVIKSFKYPIQRFDFFRYLAVYRLGGYYLDLDVFLARGLSPLKHTACVFPFEELTLSDHLRTNHGIDWEMGNYAFGAEAGHPFIKAVIENCVRGQQEPEWTLPMMRGIPGPFRGQFFVTNTTGPGLVTRTLAENAELRKTVTVLFPQDVCDERTWHRFGDYGVHLMQSSWRKRDGFIHRRLARLWESRKRGKLLRQSQKAGGNRPGEWIAHRYQ